MANYLPVLLVSLSTNALNTIPDDLVLSTAPRAQVDYLSHQWEEEDVWRSWRNMTRQKNEIANGARLENASWRTWWKQRNKLGTVSPETLNWLKDSDVTWLYGPLHTAEEWKPPPRYRPDMSCNPATTAPARPNSPSGDHSRSPQLAPYKPILKHRSISELLTSELPVTSPVFSPLESGEDSDADATRGDADAQPDPKVKRPPLLHAKSDTHIARLASGRDFRKPSPPRIDPLVIEGVEQTSLHPRLSAGGPVRASLSQDSNSSGKSAVSGSEHSRGRRKKKHISFNTFVQQYIAIDKPKKNASGYFGAIPPRYMGGRATWVGKRSRPDDDGYDEDREDSEEDIDMNLYVRNSPWGPNGSQPCVQAIHEDFDSPVEDDEDDEDNDQIEIRSSSSRSTLRPDKKSAPRSQSKVSDSSSSSASTSRSTVSSRSDVSCSTTDNTSSPSGSLSPTRRTSSSCVASKPSSSVLGGPHLYRRCATTTSISNYRPFYRPPSLRSPLEGNNSRSQHVTIAPIAPTLLKTTPAPSWTENFGDDGAGDDMFADWGWGIGGKIGSSDSVRSRKDDRSGDGGSGGLHRRRSWTSGFGCDNYGFAPGAFGTGRDARGMGFGIPVGGLDCQDDGQVSDGTPVELVYVPPFEFYSNEDLVEDDSADMEEAEQGETEEESAEIEQVEDVQEQSNHNVCYHLSVGGGAIPSSSHSVPITVNRHATVPTVVVDMDATISSFATHGEPPLTAEVDLDDDAVHLDDCPSDHYYYPMRGGRGYDYSIAGADANRGRTSNPKTFPRSSYTADSRQRTREIERNNIGNGGERKSRSRSRSESRTPSPALMSPTANTEPNPNDGRPRSYSGTSPLKNGLLSPSSTRKSSYSDLLSPPRGRQLDGPSPEEERRGRSSVRSSPSSSWDRDRGSSGSLGSSTSPLGSLSPDGGAGTRTSSGIGASFGALGRSKIERERERERERGSGDRRGREKTSSRILNAASSSEPSVTSPVGKKPETTIFSVASSSSSSTASTVIPIQTGTPRDTQEEVTELVQMQPEDILRRKSIPTTNPAGLEVKGCSESRSVGSVALTQAQMEPTLTLKKESIKTSVTNTINGSALPSSSPPASPSTPSPQRSSRYRPPLTLRPSPPIPVRPSTSLAAAVSPIGISHHNAIASTGMIGSSAQLESTIVGKAVDMVSSAGLYFGLWGRERTSSLSPSSPT